MCRIRKSVRKVNEKAAGLHRGEMFLPLVNPVPGWYLDTWRCGHHRGKRKRCREALSAANVGRAPDSPSESSGVIIAPERRSKKLHGNIGGLCEWMLMNGKM